MVSDLALSGANAPALPKGGEPLAAHANFISLPRPLPLGEVDLRSKDGEGEAVYLFKTTVWFQLFS